LKQLQTENDLTVASVDGEVACECVITAMMEVPK